MPMHKPITVMSCIGSLFLNVFVSVPVGWTGCAYKVSTLWDNPWTMLKTRRDAIRMNQDDFILSVHFVQSIYLVIELVTELLIEVRQVSNSKDCKFSPKNPKSCRHYMYITFISAQQHNHIPCV